MIVAKMADAVIEANQGEAVADVFETEETEETVEGLIWNSQSASVCTSRWSAFLLVKTIIQNMEEQIMAEITAKLVKDLREMTGAGMMDCKKALAATDGDMDKAVEFLREKGLAGAAKKLVVSQQKVL